MRQVWVPLLDLEAVIHDSVLQVVVVTDLLQDGEVLRTGQHLVEFLIFHILEQDDMIVPKAELVILVCFVKYCDNLLCYIDEDDLVHTVWYFLSASPRDSL